MIGAGATLVASLVLSSLLTGLADLLAAQALLRTIERLLSVAILALLCGVLHRTLPDAPVWWADVWPGALLAAVLLTLGTWALGEYLGHATGTPSYGAAGALVALLLWIYYSAQIFSRRRVHDCVRPSTSLARRRRFPSGPYPIVTNGHRPAVLLSVVASSTRVGGPRGPPGPVLPTVRSVLAHLGSAGAPLYSRSTSSL